MPKNPHNTAQQKRELLAALKASRGIVARACETAKVPRRNHYDWLAKDRKYAADVADIAEAGIDFAENQLIKLMQGYTLPESKVFLVDHIEVKAGKTVTTKKPLVVPLEKHVGPDTSAIIFYLKTLGKKRGYVERNEVTGKDGAPLAGNIRVEVIPAGPPLASSEKEVDDVL